MKKILVLLIPICAAMICSCQRHDAAAEQRISEREAALNAREKALDERQKALSQRQRAVTNTRLTRPELTRRHVADPAQIQAERERRIQQLPPEFRALIPDASQIQADRAEKTARAQERLGEAQRNPASGETESAAADANSPSPTSTPH